MTGIIKLAQSRLCVSTLEQIGSTELFKLPSSYYEEMKEEYCKRRDAAYEEIMQIPDVICHKPGGAFYMMVDLPIDDAEDFLMFLLTEYRDNMKRLCLHLPLVSTQHLVKAGVKSALLTF